MKSSSDLGASQTLDRSRERPRYSENTVSKSREFGSSDEESKSGAVESPSEPIESGTGTDDQTAAFDVEGDSSQQKQKDTELLASFYSLAGD